jgi:hypothetical protein
MVGRRSLPLIQSIAARPYAQPARSMASALTVPGKNGTLPLLMEEYPV